MNKLSENPVIVLLGLIASCLAIFIFVTGYENLGQIIRIKTPTPSITPSPVPTTTPTPVPSCESVNNLLRGVTVISTLLTESDFERLGQTVEVNFDIRNQQIVGPDQPADIKFVIEPNAWFKYNLTGLNFLPASGKTYNMGNNPIDSVTGLLPDSLAEEDNAFHPLCSSGSCFLEGNVLIFKTYDGNWAKLRFMSIKHYDGRTFPYDVVLTFEWVVQPNKCPPDMIQGMFKGEIIDTGTRYLRAR